MELSGQEGMHLSKSLKDGQVGRQELLRRKKLGSQVWQLRTPFCKEYLLQ